MTHWPKWWRRTGCLVVGLALVVSGAGGAPAPEPEPPADIPGALAQPLQRGEYQRVLRDLAEWPEVEQSPGLLRARAWAAAGLAVSAANQIEKAERRVRLYTGLLATVSRPGVAEEFEAAQAPLEAEVRNAAAALARARETAPAAWQRLQAAERGLQAALRLARERQDAAVTSETLLELGTVQLLLGTASLAGDEAEERAARAALDAVTERLLSDAWAGSARSAATAASLALLRLARDDHPARREILLLVAPGDPAPSNGYEGLSDARRAELSQAVRAPQQHLPRDAAAKDPLAAALALLAIGAAESPAAPESRAGLARLAAYLDPAGARKWLEDGARADPANVFWGLAQADLAMRFRDAEALTGAIAYARRRANFARPSLAGVSAPARAVFLRAQWLRTESDRIFGHFEEVVLRYIGALGGATDDYIYARWWFGNTLLNSWFLQDQVIGAVLLQAAMREAEERGTFPVDPAFRDRIDALVESMDVGQVVVYGRDGRIALVRPNGGPREESDPGPRIVMGIRHPGPALLYGIRPTADMEIVLPPR